MKRWLIVFALAAFLTATFACSYSPSLATLEQPTPTATFPTLTTATQVQSQAGSVQLVTESDLAALYERVNPGVVTIIVATPNASGSGSGFVYDKEGHILTNYHVVEGAETIEVDFTDGNKVYGEVIATDLDSDLAVIKVEGLPSNLKPLPLADFSSVKVGMIAVAIGNPFGLQGSMSHRDCFGAGSHAGNRHQSVTIEQPEQHCQFQHSRYHSN